MLVFKYYTVTCIVFSRQLANFRRGQLITSDLVHFPVTLPSATNAVQRKTGSKSWIDSQVNQKAWPNVAKFVDRDWKSFCQQICPHFSILSHKSWLIHVADYTRSKSWPRILSRRGRLSRKNNTSYSVNTLQSWWKFKMDVQSSFSFQALGNRNARAGPARADPMRPD